MGALYLLDLADVCRRTGRPVIEVDGWPHRARGSGGYDSGQPGHVIIHHTASGPSSDGWPDVNYCSEGHPDSPIGNLYLSRDGTIYVMAGGASNTNGTGQDPCGIVPDDGMNSRSIAIEAGNDGVGEPWPERQQSAYVALCDVLCDAYSIGVGQIHSHAEWAPSRKIDPAGPSWYSMGHDGTWNMDSFRGDVDNAGGAPPPEPEPPEVDLTDEQASQLNDLFRSLVLPMPGNTDPNGTEMGVNWTTVYGYRVGQSLQQMVAELGDRLTAIEDALDIGGKG